MTQGEVEGVGPLFFFLLSQYSNRKKDDFYCCNAKVDTFNP